MAHLTASFTWLGLRELSQTIGAALEEPAPRGGRSLVVQAFIQEHKDA